MLRKGEGERTNKIGVTVGEGCIADVKKHEVRTGNSMRWWEFNSLHHYGADGGQNLPYSFVKPIISIGDTSTEWVSFILECVCFGVE